MFYVCSCVGQLLLFKKIYFISLMLLDFVSAHDDYLNSLNSCFMKKNVADGNFFLYQCVTVQNTTEVPEVQCSENNLFL